MTKDELKRRIVENEQMLEAILPLSDGQDCSIYKAMEFSINDEIIYIPDVWENHLDSLISGDDDEGISYAQRVVENCYTGKDFVDVCGGDVKLAERLFRYCDWQHPSSALPEVDDRGADKTTSAAQHLAAAPVPKDQPIELNSRECGHTRNELPETCFATLPGMGDLIILKRYETGYYRSDWETGDKMKNQEIADLHNRQRGITPAQVEAMMVGSMAGFHVPGANPQVYYDEAHCVRSSVLGLGEFIKDPAISLSSPIKGNLYLYQVAGKESLYVDVASLPEALMGKRSDYTILPDMVGGKPLVPVADLHLDTLLRSRTLGLEIGSYSHGKEVNAGFEIIAKVRVGPVEYALGEQGGNFLSFVTWERTPANDGSGPPNYYWGHYFYDRENAIQDLCTRASEKYEMLAEYRKPSIRGRLAAAKAAQAEKPAVQHHHKDKGAR